MMDAIISPGVLSNSSTGLIDAETFDFNLSVSPESQKSGNVTQEEDVFVANEVKADIGQDDDDEVYLGPVSFKEQCVATRVELTEQREQNPLENLLTAEQYVELFKEANAVALQIGDGQEDRPVEPPTIPSPVGVDKDQDLNLSVDLDIAVSQNHEKEHKHGGGDMGAGLESDGLSVIERYKRLTRKTMRSPRRGTYVINKKESKLAPIVKASSERQTRTSKRRNGIAMQRRKAENCEKSSTAESNKSSQLARTSGKSLPIPRARRSSSGSQDGSRDTLNSSSSSSSSNSSVSSIPCVKRANSSQRARLSKLRPPKVSQDTSASKRSPLAVQPNSQDNQGEEPTQHRKIPSSKPSLLKPSGLTKRSSGLARPKPASATKTGSPLQKRKSQPMKATLTLEKAAKTKDIPGPSDNTKMSSLRRPSTPCTPRGQEKPVFSRKRILSSASSCSTTAVSRSSCSELDSSIPSVSTPARSRRKSCLPTSSKETPGSVKRRSGVVTPCRRPALAIEPLSSRRRHSSNKAEGSPPSKKPAVLKAVQSNIMDHSSPLNASTPDLMPTKLSKLRVKEEPSTSPVVGTLINFNELPTKSVQNPFLKELFKTEEVKENLIEF